MDEIDQIVLGEADDAVEQGPLAPEPDAIAVAHLGGVFCAPIISHHLQQREGTETVRRLMQDDPPARRVLTDQPYNVPIAGPMAGGQHREFAMASGDSAPSRAVPTRMC
jgi:hypothetical protein